MNKVIAKTLLGRLLEIKNGINVDTRMGICNNVDFYFFHSGAARVAFREWYDSNIQAWPEFSGSLASPIEGSLTVYLELADKWGDDEYGNARRLLLDWMIEEFVKMVEDERFVP